MRDSEGVFIAEGPKLINELLNAANLQVQQLFAVNEWLETQAGKISIPATEVSQSELERLSLQQTPNQVLGVFKKPVFQPLQLKNTVSLLLDTIQDPGNLGTMIRCADWFGIKQVLCTPSCADAFNSKVVQASMGSIARVQVVYGEPGHWLNGSNNIPVYAAVLDGADIRQMTPLTEGIIVIGNESKGISNEVLAHCNHRITIARKGQAESLNAAVAAGIILSHLIPF